MILVRDIFQIKFGQMRQAKELWKEGQKIEQKIRAAPSRLLTDLTGPYYTLVLESTYPSLAAFENAMKEMMGTGEFGSWYQRFTPLVDSGRREIFTIVE